jgi:hypothetical protein
MAMAISLATATKENNIMLDCHNTCTLDKCIVILPSVDNQTTTIIGRCKANFCMMCGINMGDDNPRQLCGKTYCMQEDDL